MGKEKEDDEISPLPSQVDWGENRDHYPPVGLNLIEKALPSYSTTDWSYQINFKIYNNELPNPYTSVDLWYYHGRMVINANGKLMRTFRDVPGEPLPTGFKELCLTPFFTYSGHLIRDPRMAC